MKQEVDWTVKLCEFFVMVNGISAAALIAFKAPQPYFWFAFVLYVIGAGCTVYSTYKRKIYPICILGIFYLFVDGYGVYNWWPW